MMPFNPVTLATPAFIFLVIAEMIFAWLTGRGKFEARDTATSLAMGLLSVIAGAIYAGIFIAFGELLRPFRIADIGWSWGAFIVAFILDDLAYYWWHRASHRVRWLWADHVQHHSSQHYNLSTALRQPVTGILAFPGFFVRAPLFLAGFPVPLLAFVHGLNLVYQFWIHTESIGKCPAWFEAIFNTPSHHRAHHATNARYLDTNYAGVLIIWDKWFGTFVEEDASDAPRYGIVRNLATFNPLKVAMHEWFGIGKDLAGARSLREFLGYLIGPPGWSPDGTRDTSEIIRARWSRYRDAQSPAE